MNYDVLITGGGPAGLSAALTAARAGAKVAVFEKSKEIGYPIHTSGGSWIEDLERLGIPACYYHPVNEGHLISPGHRAIFHYQTPVSCILDVRGLYQYLAEIASAAGAEIFVASPVSGLITENGKPVGLHVHRHDGLRDFRAPLLIDASGVSGFVARRLEISGGFKRVGVGAEYELHAPGWPEKRVAILFGSLAAPCGYGWVFPRGNHRVRVGVGLIRPDSKADPQYYLENLLKLPMFESEFSQISRLEYHSGVIPSELFRSRTTADNLIIVGDAGGLVSTLLGEGIRFAIDIGRMAGEVAGKAVTSGRFDQHFLHKYESRWQKKYKRTFELGAAVNHRLTQYTDQDWDNKIKYLENFDAGTVAALLKGDFTARALYKVVPRFFGKILYSNVKSCFKSA